MKFTNKKVAIATLGLASGLVYLGCVHKGTVNRSMASDYGGEPPAASVFGTPEFNRTFQPQDAKEEKVAGFLQQQIPQSKEHAQVEFPPGLDERETAELWHLSEGSDVFPVRWFMNVKSQTTKDNNKGTPLYAELYRKFGIIDEPSTYAGKTYSHRYPFRYVGITASWVDADPKKADALLEYEGKPIKESEIYGVKEFEGKKSIVMVGTNCAFCHSGNVQVGDSHKLIDGAPNMMYIRGFFQDIAGSTVKTLLDEKLLEDLLRDTGAQGNLRVIAKQLSDGFRNELLDPTWGKKLLGEIIEDVSSSRLFSVAARVAADKKAQTVKKALFQKRTVVQKYLEKLLALTYGMKEEELTPTMRLRMKYLSVLLGTNPKVQVTNEGYARTDAFGRISNLVARGDDPIDLVATVSLPPMWAIKYKAAFHYNSNTNSVIMRNVGQAFGLGAILTGEPGCKDDNNNACHASTVNLYNLNRLESLLYKLKVPNWQEMFPEDQVPEAKVDMPMAINGCNVYYKTCAGCHEAGTRVGPSHRMINTELFTPTQIGTDDVYAKLQGTKIGTTDFRVGLFDFTKKVRDRYFSEHGIDQNQVRVWQRAELRGPEVFRDTYLGAPVYDVKRTSENFIDVSYMDNEGKPGQAYTPRMLAGIWATAPYLHNGSVQNLAGLLTPPDQRPRFFFLGPATYDEETLGFDPDPIQNRKLSRGERWANASFGRRLINIGQSDEVAKCKMNLPGCFDSNEKGNGHLGHNIGTNLSSQDKRSLVEFMKVLRPEPEYSWRTAPVYKVNYAGKSATCEAVEPNEFK